MTNPSIVRETPRLIIRPLLKSDFHAFVQGYACCLPPQTPFDEGRINTDHMTESWFEKLLKNRMHEAETDYAYMLNIFRKEDGLSVGYCDITPFFREHFQYGRFGYTIHNPFWNIGYATECVSAVKSICFDTLHLHRIEAHVHPDNTASKKVLQKCGFHFECIRKGFLLENGVWTDSEIYYLNNDSWTPAQ